MAEFYDPESPTEEVDNEHSSENKNIKEELDKQNHNTVQDDSANDEELQRRNDLASKLPSILDMDIPITERWVAVDKPVLDEPGYKKTKKRKKKKKKKDVIIEEEPEAFENEMYDDEFQARHGSNWNRQEFREQSFSGHHNEDSNGFNGGFNNGPPRFMEGNNRSFDNFEQSCQLPPQQQQPSQQPPGFMPPPMPQQMPPFQQFSGQPPFNNFPPNFNRPPQPYPPNVPIQRPFPPNFPHPERFPNTQAPFMQQQNFFQQQQTIFPNQQFPPRPLIMPPETMQQTPGPNIHNHANQQPPLMPVVHPAAGLQAGQTMPQGAPPPILQENQPKEQHLLLDEIQLPPPPADDSDKHDKSSREKESKSTSKKTIGTDVEPIEIEDSPPNSVEAIDDPEMVAEQKESEELKNQEEEQSTARKLLNRVMQATKSGAKQLPDLNQLPPTIGKGLLNVRSSIKPKISFQVKSRLKTVDGSGGESDEEEKQPLKRDLSLRPKIVKKTEIFKPDEDDEDPTVQQLVKIRDSIEQQERIQKEEYQKVFSILNNQSQSASELKDPTAMVRNTVDKLDEVKPKKASRWSQVQEENTSVDNLINRQEEISDNTSVQGVDNEKKTDISNSKDEKLENSSTKEEKLKVDGGKPRGRDRSRSNSREKRRKSRHSSGERSLSREKSHDKSRHRSRERSREKRSKRSRSRSDERRSHRSNRRRSRSRDRVYDWPRRDRSYYNRQPYSRHYRSDYSRRYNDDYRKSSYDDKRRESYSSSYRSRRRSSRSRSRSRSNSRRVRSVEKYNERTSEAKLKTKNDGSPQRSRKPDRKIHRDEVESTESQTSSDNSSDEEEEEQNEKGKSMKKNQEKESSNSSESSESDENSEKTIEEKRGTQSYKSSNSDNNGAKMKQKNSESSSDSSDSSEDSTSESEEDVETSNSEIIKKNRNNVDERKYSKNLNLEKNEKYKEKENLHHQSKSREQFERKRHDSSSEDDSSSDEKKKKKQSKEKSAFVGKSRKKYETSTSEDTSPEDRSKQTSRKSYEKATVHKKDCGKSYKEDRSSEGSSRKKYRESRDDVESMDVASDNEDVDKEDTKKSKDSSIAQEETSSDSQSESDESSDEEDSTKSVSTDINIHVEKSQSSKGKIETKMNKVHGDASTLGKDNERWDKDRKTRRHSENEGREHSLKRNREEDYQKESCKVSKAKLDEEDSGTTKRQRNSEFPHTSPDKIQSSVKKAKKCSRDSESKDQKMTIETGVCLSEESKQQLRLSSKDLFGVADPSHDFQSEKSSSKKDKISRSDDMDYTEGTDQIFSKKFLKDEKSQELERESAEFNYHSSKKGHSDKRSKDSVLFPKNNAKTSDKSSSNEKISDEYISSSKDSKRHAGGEELGEKSRKSTKSFHENEDEISKETGDVNSSKKHKKGLDDKKELLERSSKEELDEDKKDKYRHSHHHHHKSFDVEEASHSTRRQSDEKKDKTRRSSKEFVEDEFERTKHSCKRYGEETKTKSSRSNQDLLKDEFEDVKASRKHIEEKKTREDGDRSRHSSKRLSDEKSNRSSGDYEDIDTDDKYYSKKHSDEKHDRLRRTSEDDIETSRHSSKRQSDEWKDKPRRSSQEFPKESFEEMRYSSKKFSDEKIDKTREYRKDYGDDLLPRHSSKRHSEERSRKSISSYGEPSSDRSRHLGRHLGNEDLPVRSYDRYSDEEDYRRERAASKSYNDDGYDMDRSMSKHVQDDMLERDRWLSRNRVDDDISPRRYEGSEFRTYEDRYPAYDEPPLPLVYDDVTYRRSKWEQSETEWEDAYSYEYGREFSRRERDRALPLEEWDMEDRIRYEKHRDTYWRDKEDPIDRFTYPDEREYIIRRMEEEDRLIEYERSRRLDDYERERAFREKKDRRYGGKIYEDRPDSISRDDEWAFSQKEKDSKMSAAEAEISYYTGKRSRQIETSKPEPLLKMSTKHRRSPISPEFTHKREKIIEKPTKEIPSLLDLDCSMMPRASGIIELPKTNSSCYKVDSASKESKARSQPTKDILNEPVKRSRPKFTDHEKMERSFEMDKKNKESKDCVKIAPAQSTKATDIDDKNSSLACIHNYDGFTSESDRESAKPIAPQKLPSNKAKFIESTKQEPDSSQHVAECESFTKSEIPHVSSKLGKDSDINSSCDTQLKTLTVDIERLTDYKIDSSGKVNLGASKSKLQSRKASDISVNLTDIPLPGETEAPAPRQTTNVEISQSSSANLVLPSSIRRSSRISARKGSTESQEKPQIKNEVQEPIDTVSSTGSNPTTETSSNEVARPKITMKFTSKWDKTKVKVGETEVFGEEVEKPKLKLDPSMFMDDDGKTPAMVELTTLPAVKVEDEVENSVDTKLEETKEIKQEPNFKTNSPPRMKTRRSSRLSAQAANEALLNLNNNSNKKARGKKTPDLVSKEEIISDDIISQTKEKTIGTKEESVGTEIPVDKSEVTQVTANEVSGATQETFSVTDQETGTKELGKILPHGTDNAVDKRVPTENEAKKLEEEIKQKLIEEEENKKSKSDWRSRDDGRRERDRYDDKRDRNKRYYDDDDDRDRYRSSDRDRDYDDRRYRSRERGRYRDRERDRDRDDYYRSSRRERDRSDYDRHSRRRYDREGSYESRSRSPEYVSSKRNVKDEAEKKAKEAPPTFDPPMKIAPQDIFHTEANKVFAPQVIPPVVPEFRSSENQPFNPDPVDIPPPPSYVAPAQPNVITIVPTQIPDSSTSPPKPLKVKSRWLLFSEAEALESSDPMPADEPSVIATPHQSGRSNSNLVPLTGHAEIPIQNIPMPGQASYRSPKSHSNLVSIVPVDNLPSVPFKPSTAPVPSTYRPQVEKPSSPPVVDSAADPAVSTGISEEQQSLSMERPLRKRRSIFENLTNQMPDVNSLSDVSSSQEAVSVSELTKKEATVPISDEVESKMPEFERITENLYLTERHQSKQMKRMICDCTTSKEDRENGSEACGNDCLNRMLYIECGSRCPCGEYCTNKRFQNLVYSNVEAFQTSWKGWGLRAVEELDSDRFIMEYVGEVLDYKGFKNRSKQYAKENQKHFYFMALNPDVLIDATLKGNISRFINHSCDPNCETQKWTVNGELRIGFFTKKKILPGEELTFNYQFETYGQEAQKCFCGSENCRGVIGIEKAPPIKNKKKDKIVKKKENIFAVDEIEEQIERMSAEGLRNKNHVLNLCRLMVYVQQTDHRIAILKILQNTPEPACQRLFVEYHGLPLLWSWMADIQEPSSEFQFEVVSLLSELPITNRTVLQDSKILSVIEKWTEISEADSNVELPPPPPTTVPVGILSCTKDTKEAKEKAPKKRVTFAEETASSDSDLSEVNNLITSSEASSSTSGTQDSVEGECLSSESVTADASNVSSKATENVEQSDIVQSTQDMDSNADDVVNKQTSVAISEEKSHGEADSSGSTSGADMDSDMSQSVKSSDKIDIENTEASKSSDCAVELSATEEESQDDGSSTDSVEKPERLSLCAVASKLLEQWSSLKEVFKIPRKERVEERKRTERELDTRYEETADSPFANWSTKRKGKSKKRGGSTEDPFDQARLRRTLLPTPPKMSKEERRQLFEAQVKAQDELNAEFQRQQLEALQAAYPCVPPEFFQDPGFLHQLEHNPNFALQLQDPNFVLQLQDPNFVLQFQDPNLSTQMQQDPNLAMQMQHDANLALQLQQDPNLAMQIQQDPNLALQLQHDPNLAAQMQDPNVALQLQGVMDGTQQQQVGGMQHPVVGVPQVMDVNGQLIQTGMLPQDANIPQQTQVLMDPNGQHILYQQQYQVQTSQGVMPPSQQYYQMPQGVVVQQPQVSTVPQTVQVTDQNLVQQQLQQLLSLQQNLTASIPSTSQAILEEDVPPPPSPPKSKTPKLPPHWKSAKDAEGKVYYYHGITRQTQWEPPTWEQGDMADMDLGTPTFDEFGKKKKKTQTAAADTSSEREKRLKDMFRKEMSTYIVSCLNPYRKPDCKAGRIISTDDFKHLARKLTHHVMAKELKHCRHVDDLEVNENVKSKAKDYVRKYMSKSGAVYKKPIDDDVY